MVAVDIKSKKVLFDVLPLHHPDMEPGPGLEPGPSHYDWEK